jgi:hypothetical protein
MKSSARVRRAAVLAAMVVLIAGLADAGGMPSGRPVHGDEDAPPARVAAAFKPPAPEAAPAQPFPRRGSPVRRDADRPDEGGGLWLGTAGLALALALCGAISLAIRRGGRWPHVPAVAAVRVVGRTSLSPRHTVHVLSVGDRLLLVGTGPQGAPSLLGELTEADAKAEGVQRPITPEQPRNVVVNWRKSPGVDR